jgi:hypothetical protein
MFGMSTLPYPNFGSAGAGRNDGSFMSGVAAGFGPGSAPKSVYV